MKYPVTPDGRYFVVRGRLWRRTDPSLDADTRATLTTALMRARCDVRQALAADDSIALADARARVDRAKAALGERGAPWWTDGSPDYGRRMARNTPYAEWHAALGSDHDGADDRSPSASTRSKRVRERARREPATPASDAAAGPGED